MLCTYREKYRTKNTFSKKSWKIIFQIWISILYNMCIGENICVVCIFIMFFLPFLSLPRQHIYHFSLLPLCPELTFKHQTVDASYLDERHLDGGDESVLKPFNVFTTGTWELHVLVHPFQKYFSEIFSPESQPLASYFSGRRGVKDWPLRYTTGSCLMLVQRTSLEPLSVKMNFKAFSKPILVGWPVPNTR